MSKLRANLPANLASSETLIEVDGHDITNTVNSLSIDAEAGNMPTVTVGLVIRNGITLEVDGEYLRVTEATAGLLRALGWKPPAE